MIVGSQAKSFSDAYPSVVKLLDSEGSLVASRNGVCKEFLNFHTEIACPQRRFVGGNNRGMNPFFLIAEAIWIAAGHSDVAFLSIFNSGIAKYSDDGKVFHAPYGFRLRKYGARAEDGDRLVSHGIDQVATVIRMLWNDPSDRRAVMSIWDAKQDLAVDSKDIPCNDMVMIKVRDRQMHTTICNRSNDVHWGLPTNVFQFSFITELMAGCLDYVLGTQTHISQSLHLYDWHEDITDAMRFCGFSNYTLYEGIGANCIPIDFNFESEVPPIRYVELSNYLNDIIVQVKRAYLGEEVDKRVLDKIWKFSKILYAYTEMLLIYIDYKKSEGDKEERRHRALNSISALCVLIEAAGYRTDTWDLYYMCSAFFMRNLKDRSMYDQELVRKLTAL